MTNIAEETRRESANAHTEPTAIRSAVRRIGDRSQSYSVRMPIERLTQLRDLAHRSHLSPSTLMRAWVLERLDSELSGDGGVLRTPDDVRRVVLEELDRLGLLADESAS